ncbi:Ubiquitin carboxyl-terminal hydrolase 10 [Hondaea fermentalgiana]|uniref:Ubiquitin carboxyl-terminal hydrolase n=1 Tax=Hondaea fermentalgiana TaxID=2315210 RepID=A0A2R5FZD5_9STRA|nr:Ubiquitin carboxyl-terminal hydrolase 10 [Hondaea fermentalgiana]|eukprot:GBG24112.1 Ubiquitin carboxyl-terminal hydrolase 10 [Hondaea fermentalgiana]
MLAFGRFSAEEVRDISAGDHPAVKAALQRKSRAAAAAAAATSASTSAGPGAAQNGAPTKAQTNRAAATAAATAANDSGPAAAPEISNPPNAKAEMASYLRALVQRKAKHRLDLDAPERKTLVSARRGLYNLGNTCFINAVIQSLVLTPSLGSVWFAVLDKIPDLEASLDAERLEEVQTLRSLSELAVELLGSEQLAKAYLDRPVTAGATAVRPDEFIWLIRDFFENQGLTNRIQKDPTSEETRVRVHVPQQDAHEFLEWLLDRLNDEQVALLKSGASSSSESPSSDAPWANGSNNEAAHGNNHLDVSLESIEASNMGAWADEASGDGDADADGWQEVGRKGRNHVTTRVGHHHDDDEASVQTFISESFQGIVRSSLRTPGARESITLQPFMCLQLEVLNKAVRSVLDGLDLFMSPEILTDLLSQKHGNIQRGQKSLLFDKLPRVLILHLKRFVYDKKTNSPLKLNKLVTYPSKLVIPDNYLSTKLRQQLHAQGAAASSAASSSAAISATAGAGEPGTEPIAAAGPGAVPSMVPSGTFATRISSPAELREYQLHAVVQHQGNAAVQGHYISWTLDTATGAWMEHNDDKAKPKSLSEVLDNRDAYLLFYSRKH